MNPIRAVLQSVSDALLIVSADGRISNVNQGACRLTGRPVSELLDRPLISLVDARVAAELALLLAHGRAEQQARFEGSWVGEVTATPLLFNVTKLSDGGLCIRLREAPQSSLEARYDRALLSAMTVNLASDMMIWTDVNANIVFANASARAHFSRLDSGLIKKPIYEIDPNYNKDRWDEFWCELEAKKHLRIETVNQIGPTRLFRSR